MPRRRAQIMLGNLSAPGGKNKRGAARVASSDAMFGLIVLRRA